MQKPAGDFVISNQQKYWTNVIFDNELSIIRIVDKQFSTIAILYIKNDKIHMATFFFKYKLQSIFSSALKSIRDLLK